MYKSSYTYSDGDVDLVVQVLHLLGVTGKQGLLNEQWSVGLEKLGQLLSHWLVQSTVEVTGFSTSTVMPLGEDLQTSIHTDGLDICQSLNGLVQSVRRI